MLGLWICAGIMLLALVINMPFTAFCAGLPIALVSVGKCSAAVEHFMGIAAYNPSALHQGLVGGLFLAVWVFLGFELAFER